MSVSQLASPVRAVTFATSTVLLAAGAHTIAMGAAPALWAMAVAGVALLLIALVAGRRDHHALTLMVAVPAAQVALHLWFAATMAHGQRLMVLCSLHPPATHSSMLPSLPMTTGHALAAVLLGCWLARLQDMASAFWTAARAQWARTWRRVPICFDQPRRAALPVASARASSPLLQLFARVLPERGPPAMTPCS